MTSLSVLTATFIDIWQRTIKNQKKKTRKCYKYDKVEYFVSNCRSGQKMKNKSVQEDSDNEDKENNDKEKSFIRDLE